MKFSKLAQMSAAQIGRLSESEIRASYQEARKVINSRLRTFAKHGAPETAIPAGLRGGLGSSKGVSSDEIVQRLREAVMFGRRKSGIYSGYMEQLESRRQKIQDALPNVDLSDMDKFKQFGDFMDEVADRIKSMKHPPSSQAVDLYVEADRLNINKDMLLKNLDYWLDHVEDLQKSDPIRTRSERELQPSEYARKLGLEKINGGGRRK